MFVWGLPCHFSKFFAILKPKNLFENILKYSYILNELQVPFTDASISLYFQYGQKKNLYQYYWKNKDNTSTNTYKQKMK